MMVGIGEVIVTFDLDETAFDKLRRGLTLAFRAFSNFWAMLDA
jgi:hypothetical protein